MTADLEKLPWAARESIAQALDPGKSAPDVPLSLSQYKAGVFVTLYSKGKQLRGCIGTITPCYDNVWIETIKNAKKSAFEDNRFMPLGESELDHLSIEVSVLHDSQNIEDDADLDKWLDPRDYGIIVTSRSGKRALLLPDIEGVDLWSQQIEICRKKGNMSPNEKIKIERFKVDKYRE